MRIGARVILQSTLVMALAVGLAGPGCGGWFDRHVSFQGTVRDAARLHYADQRSTNDHPYVGSSFQLITQRRPAI